MSRPDLKAEFAFMRIPMIKPVGSCCGGARQATAQYQIALDNVKRQMISMTEVQKARFKELTKVAQVVIFIGGTERFAF
jgi:hypothetical protein